MTQPIEGQVRSRATLNDPRMTTAVFSAVVAIMLAGIYCVSRAGFKDNSYGLVLLPLCISFFLLFFPPVCRSIIWDVRPKGKRTWMGSDAGLSLIALCALPLLAIAGCAFGVSLGPAVAISGLVMFFASMSTWLWRGSLWRSLVFLMLAAFFGTWVAGAVWGSGFQNPLYEEALAGGYYLCKDVLVVSSMTGMLRTFDFPATGLDGLVYCGYHWGAYWFFAQLADMLRLETVRFGQLGFPVIFLPFLLSRFLEFAIHAGERLAEQQSLRDLRVDVPFWLMVCVGWIGFLPTEVATKMRFGENIIFFSESYSVAMSLTFIALSLSLWLLRASGNGQKSHQSFTILDHCLILLLPLLVAGVGLTKISLMYILVIMYGYLFLRLGLWRYKTPILALVMGVVALPVMVQLTSRAGAGGGYAYVYPLAFFVSNIPFAWKPFFFILYYFWSWVFIIQRFAARHVVTLSDLMEAWRNKKVIDAEAVAVVCIVGGAPAYMLPIGGASGLFFMDFQWWFALGLILAHRERLRRAFSTFPELFRAARSDFRTIHLQHVLVLSIGICIGASVLANGTLTVWRMVYQNLSIRNALVNPEAVAAGPETLKERFYKRLVRDLKGRNVPGIKDFVDTELRPLVFSAQSGLESARGFPLVNALRELNQRPKSEKRETLLFVPRTNRLYWDLVHSCEAVCFLGPSIAGMAMLDALPDPACTRILGHFGMYRQMRKPVASLPNDPTPLCKAAREKGFCNVIVLDADQQDRVHIRKISCP